MIATGYSALEAKNSGMVIAWPIPINRSLDMTSPAMVMDRQLKNTVPRATAAADPAAWPGSR